MSDLNLRLTDLFKYIEKLYTPQTYNYKYDKQNGNSLSHNIDYWVVAELMELQSSAKNVSSLGIKLQFEAIDKPIITLNRQDIPSFPIPEVLTDWVEVDLSKGELVKKESVSRLEQFDDSPDRIKAFKDLSISQKSLFEEQNIPEILEGWVVKDDNSDESSYVKLEQLNVETKFEDDNTRVKLFNKLETEFKSFLEKFEAQRRINRLYDGLHQKYFDLKGRDDKRINLSIGLLKGNLGDEDFINYLIDIPLKIDLNDKTIQILCDTNEKVEQNWDFFALLDSYFEKNNVQGGKQRKDQIIEAANKFSNQEIVNPLNFTDNQYLDYINAISSVFPKCKNEYLQDDFVSFDQSSLDENFDEIEVTFSPMLRVLDIDNRVYIKQDATNIINKIKELEEKGLVDTIPDFFKKLFDVGNLQDEILEETELQSSDEETESSAENYDTLFPLPSNAEQESIANRLKFDSAATVMGPPGTGKSHTIANLISNFVSQGKSILVVSQNAKALEVLYEKLPDDIQDLAVTFEDKKTSSSDLQSSVKTILSNLSREYPDENVKHLENNLKGIKTEISETKENLYKLLNKNQESFKLTNFLNSKAEEKNLQEWAELIYEHPLNPSYIVEQISSEESASKLLKSIVVLLEQSKNLTNEELNYYRLNDVPPDILPSASEFVDIVDELNELSEDISEDLYQKYAHKKFSSELPELLEDLNTRLNIIKDDEDAKAFVNSIANYKKISSVYLKAKELFKKLVKAQEYLEDYEVSSKSLDEYEPEDVLNKLTDLLPKSTNGIPISAKLNKFDRLLVRILEVKINSRIISKQKDLEIVIKHFQLKEYQKKISILFKNYVKNNNLDFESVDWKKKYMLLRYGYLINKFVSGLNEIASKNKLPQIDPSSFEKICEGVTLLNEIQTCQEVFESEKRLSDLNDLILSNEQLHPLLREITQAVNNKEVNTYKKLIEAYKDVYNEIKKAKEVYKQYQDIREEFPDTASKIFESIKNGNMADITQEELNKEISYVRIKHIIREEALQIEDASKLNDKLHNLHESLYRKTADLVAYRSWKHKVESTSDEEKQALSAWHNAVTAMGRGYGRNTERFREDAQRNLSRAKSAVPIWIMRLYTAVRYFSDVTPGQFDVLIIDEASQCDITALNLIFRSKRVVVVGDDNQTAVDINSSRFPIDFTNQVLDRYLHGHKFKEQFNINANNHSIYALSTVLYPNIISLREHFRCLPAIINYSKEYVYDGDLVPLRTASKHPYGKPVEVYYVEDFTDEKENIVSKVVEEIIRIIERSESQSLKLPTVGVLCLDSSDLKHQQTIQKALVANEVISNRIEDMNLQVGTSREFQGDERDVMILTISASHSINQKGEIRPPKAVMSEVYKRIYNVAASRARNRSVLIHSINPDAVAKMNTDCWRYKLINYYQNIDNEDFHKKLTREDLLSKTDPNSGDFEKSVCRFLIDNNYGDFITPQYQIGPYKIDFGVILPNGEDNSESKLAIECDGYQYHNSANQVKEDIDRQIILERAGWQFYRVNSIEWYGEREKVEGRMRSWLVEKSKR